MNKKDIKWLDKQQYMKGLYLSSYIEDYINCGDLDYYCILSQLIAQKEG